MSFLSKQTLAQIKINVDRASFKIIFCSLVERAYVGFDKSSISLRMVNRKWNLPKLKQRSYKTGLKCSMNGNDKRSDQYRSQRGKCASLDERFCIGFFFAPIRKNVFETQCAPSKGSIGPPEENFWLRYKIWPFNNIKN